MPFSVAWLRGSKKGYKKQFGCKGWLFSIISTNLSRPGLNFISKYSFHMETEFQPPGLFWSAWKPKSNFSASNFHYQVKVLKHFSLHATTVCVIWLFGNQLIWKLRQKIDWRAVADWNIHSVWNFNFLAKTLYLTWDAMLLGLKTDQNLRCKWLIEERIS